MSGAGTGGVDLQRHAVWRVGIGSRKIEQMQRRRRPLAVAEIGIGNRAAGDDARIARLAVRERKLAAFGEHGGDCVDHARPRAEIPVERLRRF
ncbi:MAG TPA: hypothetical protein VKB52_03980, partial [Rhodanobacteraceae bacterium]|nr:hypothetical protein [Rhodanobacteraceae bacterium]